MYCSNCGLQKASQTDKFCKQCGTGFESVESDESTAAAVQPSVRRADATLTTFLENVRLRLRRWIGRGWDLEVPQAAIRAALVYTAVVYGLLALQTFTWWVLGAGSGRMYPLDTGLNFLDWVITTAVFVLAIRAIRMTSAWRRQLDHVAAVALALPVFDFVATLLRAGELDVWPNPMLSIITVVLSPIISATPLLFVWAMQSPAVSQGDDEIEHISQDPV